MYTRQKILAQLITASFISVSGIAYANIQIIPQQNEVTESRFVSTPKLQPDNKEVIKAEFESIPFGIVIDTIKPSDWSLDYLNNSENKIVSWSGESKSWIDVVKFISINNDIIADIDYSNRSIVLSRESETVAPKESDDQDKPKTSAADLLIECKDSKCDKQVINIEKLALDTSWVDVNDKKVEKTTPIFDLNEEFEKGKGDLLAVNHADIAKIAEEEEHFDKELEAEHKLKETKLRREYMKTYVLHGNGTFEDFVNGGGELKSGDANPSDSYTYVYKKGTLFSSIDKWAQLNGYTIKNDVKDKLGKDYGNISTVYLKGDFYSVTTRLLDKYQQAEYPINHKFYKKGKVLHIFSGRYNASMGGAK